MNTLVPNVGGTSANILNEVKFSQAPKKALEPIWVKDWPRVRMPEKPLQSKKAFAPM